MADTKEVVKQLKMPSSHQTKLLAIVANLRGAEEAIPYDEISYLGFPFSISPSFQIRNTNSSLAQSLQTVESIQELCTKNNKALVVYLSMGFGNPYGDEYSEELLLKWADEMVQRGIGIISLADTVGLATPAQIRFALDTLIPKYPDTIIGVHLHATKDNWKAKLDAALQSGCKRFDGALKGIGGCPMAQEDLVGNLDSIAMLSYFEQLGMGLAIKQDALAAAIQIANEIFVS